MEVERAVVAEEAEAIGEEREDVAGGSIDVLFPAAVAGADEDGGELGFLLTLDGDPWCE